MKTKPLRLAELIEHFRQRELAADNEWKTLSESVEFKLIGPLSDCAKWHVAHSKDENQWRKWGTSWP
jgi:hypothetical protein